MSGDNPYDMPRKTLSGNKLMFVCEPVESNHSTHELKFGKSTYASFLAGCKARDFVEALVKCHVSEINRYSKFEYECVREAIINAFEELLITTNA